VLSVVVAAGLAAFPALASTRAQLPLGIGGAVAVAVLALALVLRQAWLIAPAVALLGAEYCAYVALHGGTVDARSPVVGVGLLAVAELAFATLELRAGSSSRELAARRVAAMTVVALGGIAVGVVVLAVSSVPLGGGVGLEVVGVAAAVLLLLALGRLAVRPR
jgi:hypothetical protein